MGCAAGTRGARPLSPPVRRLAAEAMSGKPIRCEEDMIDARMVFQALPITAKERIALRGRLLHYLLDPIASLDPGAILADPSAIGSPDDFERLFDSLKDALDLFAPSDFRASAAGPDEVQLVTRAAAVVLAIYSPRGNEAAVALSLFVLTSLQAENAEWHRRLDELLAWVEQNAEMQRTSPTPRSAPTLVEVLEAVAAHWPAPSIIDRLATIYVDRQQRLVTTMRRPLGTGNADHGLGDFLLEGETVQATALSVAALYLRSGRREQAAASLARVAGKPGDDPELRELLAATLRRGAGPREFLALSRRFLPRIDLLGGTSGDRLDPVVAAQVLEEALDLFPKDIETLALASRVARFLPAPLLALRYLEEAQAAMEKSASPGDLANLNAELLDLSFVKLRGRIDPERIEPVADEAEALRQLSADIRKRFGADKAHVQDGEIDFELGRGFVDAGLIDRAQTSFKRAREAGNSSADVVLQLANLAQKSGDPRRAAQLLGEALQRHQANAPPQETIPYVEAQSKLARALGGALEIAGSLDDAQPFWKISVKGWERLMIEHLRRKNASAAAEATFEVGRLYYLLDRRDEGKRKFLEAIEQDDARDQGYIDAMSFLVQQGETDAALGIYRLALSKPTRAVSEYVKVYASFWILDLTRRTGTPDAAAEGYLRALCARKVTLRPPRAAAWYLPLARFALGNLTYEQILAQADTAGKRAEVYFYEAMRRLAEGKADDAHALWNKVLETKMFSFFEFDMASRYLRTGAPTGVRPPVPESAKTI